MPSKKKSTTEVPATIARSGESAINTYRETLDSAVAQYGDGERAHRTAFASLKHTHEKVGDHWEPKQHNGPPDEQAEKSGAAARAGGPTAEGVDANATKAHLVEVARRVGVKNARAKKKVDLVEEIVKANRRLSAKALREGS